MAYRVTGEKHYLDTLVNSYDYLTTHQTYATGGYGPKEQFQKNYDALVQSLTADSQHFETQCGSWAAFKLVKCLIRFTGDARFGDWVELLAYNGIGASIPMNPPGHVQYWGNYHLYGGAKAHDIYIWPCCSGTFPEAAADYYDLIWFKDAASLYVNLYTPSTVHWNCDGGPLTVSQTGVLEENKGIDFAVSTKSAVAFAMKFRMPGWLAARMRVAVNGREFPATADAKHWLVVERTWRDGDKLTLKAPLGVYAKRLDPAKLYPSAAMYGPIVLCGPISAKRQASRINMGEVAGELAPAAAGAARFRLKSDTAVVLRPFYDFARGEGYFMYIDPHMADK